MPDLEEAVVGLPSATFRPINWGGWHARVLAGVVRPATPLPQNVADYLAHERADLVPRREGDQVTSGVDRLREDVDRSRRAFQLLAP